MIKKIFTLVFILSAAVMLAKKKEIRVPMTANAWEHDKETVEFVTHRSVPAIQPKDGKSFKIYLKNQQFTNGTIEFDVEFTGRGFPGIGFRVADDRKNEEFFYIRYFGSIDPLNRYALQYATVIDGINMWDMTDDYQAAAKIYDEGWNHVKMVIHGKQMRVYINDMDKVALHVPSLEGTTETGSVYLTGSVIYANLTLKPNQVDDLPKVEGYDPTYSDTRYLKKWLTSPPVDLPFNVDIVKGVNRAPGVIIDSTLLDDINWQPIMAERRGMVNLTRKYGATANGKRRLGWLKTTIMSETAQVRTLNLGFSDEVWVFINGEPLYIDKNYYGSPGMKQPRGRCTIENSQIKLPLKEGENEILIGVANYFFGWGIVARLDSTDNLKLVP